MLVDQLRLLVAHADVSRYSISKATGIDQSVLSRFVHGEAGMSIDSINRLGEFFDLELRPRAKGRTTKGG